MQFISTLRLLQRGFTCLLLLLSSTNVLAAVIYVDIAAAGANNGSSWADAYTSLESALATASPGDEIWVANGVYKPTSLLDLDGSGGADAREAVFQLPNGVALYGGFAGTEMNRNERDWLANLSILSGDIDNNDDNGDGNGIAENTSQLAGNNAYHVLYTLNADATTIVDGFVITAGNANLAGMVTNPNRYGGGWYNDLGGVVNAGSPTLRHNRFQGNFAEQEGGAIYNRNGSAGASVNSIVYDCRFLYNATGFAGGAVALGSFSPGNYSPSFTACTFTGNEALRRGGAVYMTGDHAIFDSCKFSENRVTAVAVGETLPGSGGAVGMTASNAAFAYCYFYGNSATGNATGPFEGGGGGAVYMSANEPQSTSLGPSAPSFLACGFYENDASGNTAAWGGAAVHLSDGGQLRPSYVNCVFAGNTAQNDGGAIANFARVLGVEGGYVPDFQPAFTNCTFYGNSAGQRGGAFYNDGFLFMATELLQVQLVNSILSGNSAIAEGQQIFNTGTNIIAYSLVAGSGGSGAGWDPAIGTDGGNNLDEPPGFVNASDPDGADDLPATNDDGLRLGATSAAVDAGTNAAAGLAGISTDYIGQSRILGTVVDMGAYERAGIVIPDLDIYWLNDWDDVHPPCFICPWAFLFRDQFIRQFRWDGPAQLVIEKDVAHVKGRIVHVQRKNLAMEVYLKLVNKRDWTAWSGLGRTYTSFSNDAEAVAKNAHINWSYWELSPDSYLRGSGALQGTLRLGHFPGNFKTGFQFGKGANGWDKDQGMSGTFRYTGTLHFNGKKMHFNSIGSMNVDAVPCKENCIPSVKNTIIEPSLSDKKVVSIYPNPVRDYLTITLPQNGKINCIVKVHALNGQLKKTIPSSAVEGRLSVNTADLVPGIYLVSITMADGSVYSTKFMRE